MYSKKDEIIDNRIERLEDKISSIESVINKFDILTDDEKGYLYHKANFDHVFSTNTYTNASLEITILISELYKSMTDIKLKNPTFDLSERLKLIGRLQNFKDSYYCLVGYINVLVADLKTLINNNIANEHINREYMKFGSVSDIDNMRLLLSERDKEIEELKQKIEFLTEEKKQEFRF